jgi:hypothetical protein
VSIEELLNFCSSPSVIIMIKSRMIRWHVARIGEKMIVYTISVGKPEGKRQLGNSRHRWKDNIKIDLGEIGWSEISWIHLAQDRD